MGKSIDELLKRKKNWCIKKKFISSFGFKKVFLKEFEKVW